MKRRINRNLAILCAMALTTSVVVGFAGISQATPSANCTGPSVSATPTPAGTPLLLAGTKISWATDCTGNTTSLPVGISVKDPAGNLVTRIASATSGTGNLSSSQDLYLPVQGGYEVCVELPTKTECVKTPG